MSGAEVAVSIIIVSYNTRELLAQCVQSVMDNTRDCACEIIVVDNASTDNSVPALRARFPAVRVIENTENKGFAAANNQGAALAGAAALLFLNPDTIVQQDAIPLMLHFLDSREDAGVVGCRLLNADGSLQQSSWRHFPDIRWCWKSALYLNDSPPGEDRRNTQGSDEPQEVSHLLGACIMLRRELYDQLNGFDERYFLYMEETDLCYRARELGRHNYTLPAASVVHLGQQSSMQGGDWTSVQLQFSTYAFIRKNRSLSAGGRALLLAGMQTGGLVRAVLWASRWVSGKRDRRTARGMLKGYLRLLFAAWRFESVLRSNGDRASRLLT